MTSTPNLQLPTPKPISSKRVPWELEVGSWELIYFNFLLTVVN